MPRQTLGGSGDAALFRVIDPVADRPSAARGLDFDDGKHRLAGMGQYQVEFITANTNISAEQAPTSQPQVPANRSFATSPRGAPLIAADHRSGNRESAILHARSTMVRISSWMPR